MGRSPVQGVVPKCLNRNRPESLITNNCIINLVCISSIFVETKLWWEIHMRMSNKNRLYDEASRFIFMAATVEIFIMSIQDFQIMFPMVRVELTN